MAIILSLFALLSTCLGGLVAFRYRDRLHLVMGFTAGVLLAVVAFDLFPEITRLIQSTATDPVWPMIALVCGFLLFHIVEKSVLIHQGHEGRWGVHTHPTVGLISALALSAHSFLDGVGIGLAFHVSSSVGILVAIAVVAHDFSDGLNTVSLMLVNHNTNRRSVTLLGLDAIAPLLGALATYLFTISDAGLLWYLGFFAGFLLYIGASDILPEAHSRHSSVKTIMLTVIGVCFIFLVTRIV
ncbi:MAG TPA: ZIP family metal transporter [Patescibacteria group bacterium]|nr:ZIP family metal transporter [Patescibacteria group bacterium]